MPRIETIRNSRLLNAVSFLPQVKMTSLAFSRHVIGTSI